MKFSATGDEVMKRLKGVMTLLSQLANVVLLGGHPDETISGRAYRRGVLCEDPAWAKARERIDWIFVWEKNHCRKSHLRDVDFALMILALRSKAERDE